MISPRRLLPLVFSVVVLVPLALVSFWYFDEVGEPSGTDFVSYGNPVLMLDYPPVGPSLAGFVVGLVGARLGSLLPLAFIFLTCLALYFYLRSGWALFFYACGCMPFLAMGLFKTWVLAQTVATFLLVLLFFNRQLGRAAFLIAGIFLTHKFAAVLALLMMLGGLPFGMAFVGVGYDGTLAELPAFLLKAFPTMLFGLPVLLYGLLGTRRLKEADGNIILVVVLAGLFGFGIHGDRVMPTVATLLVIPAVSFVKAQSKRVQVFIGFSLVASYWLGMWYYYGAVVWQALLHGI